MQIPKSTPTGAPVNYQIPLMAGVIERIDLTIPDGCSGLVGCQVWDRGKIIVPLGTPGEWLSGNNKVFTLNRLQLSP